MRPYLLLVALPACTPMPELHFNEPPAAPAVVIEPALPTTEDDLVAVIDGASVDPEGDEVTYTVGWYVDGVLLRGGTSLPASYTTRGETWQAVVVPTDGEFEGEAGEASVTIEDAVPQIDQMSLSPTAPTTTDDLVLSVSGSDPDDETVTFLVSWAKNGEVQALYANATTIPAAATQSGEDWTATVTPSDGTETGQAQALSVYIDNTAPVIGSVRVLPTAPTVEDAIGVTVTWEDPDEPGQTVSVACTWYVDGVEVMSETVDDGTSFLRDGFAKGQEVSVTVVPSDGYATGSPQSSEPVTIANTPPVLVDVGLTPTSGYESTSFECVPGTSTDADDDSVSYDYAWYVNGTEISSTDDVLTGASFDSGDEIYCVVTPEDIDDSGDPVTSDTSTVANSLPSLTSVSISPTSPTVATQLTATLSGGTDPDGDPINYTYSWTVDGVVVGTSTSNLGTAYFQRGDEVEVTVTPSDAGGAGASVTATAVEIANALPSLASASITPNNAYTDDDLAVNLSGWSDADGDTASYEYQWYRNSVAISGQTSATLDEAYTTKSDRIFCNVTPYDGIDYGTARISSIITVQNSVPDTLADVSTGLAATECDTIELDATASDDVDGDTLTYNWSLTTRPSGSLTSTTDIDAVTDAEPTFLVDYAGTFVFSLSASDGSNSASDSVSVTVYDAASNEAPVPVPSADEETIEATTGCSSSGSGFVCTACTGTFEIDAANSWDAEDDPLHYTWSTSSGYATIASATSESTTVTMRNMPTTHLTTVTYQATVTLRVQDCAGNYDTEDLVLTYACTGN